MLAGSIQEGIDTIATNIDGCTNELCTGYDTLRIPNTTSLDAEQIDIGGDGDDYTVLDDEDSRLIPLPEFGSNVEVYWPLDDKLYPGTVASINEDDNKYIINYSDGDIETLYMSNEVWRYSTDNSVTANLAQVPEKSLVSSEQDVLGSFVNFFGQKVFVQYQTQGLPMFSLQNAYKKEEESFKKTVQMVHVSKVPADANVITRHVIYKVKTNDDGSLKMKARIAPHGNKDNDRQRDL